MKAIVIRKGILHRILLRYVRPAGTNRGLQVTRCRLERHSGHDTTVNKQYYKCHPARDLITIRNRGNCFSQLFINRAVIFTCDKGSLINAYRYVRWHSLFSRFFFQLRSIVHPHLAWTEGLVKKQSLATVATVKADFVGITVKVYRGVKRKIMLFFLLKQYHQFGLTIMIINAKLWITVNKLSR